MSARSLVGILPWAIVLVIAGAAIGLLLDRQVVLGRAVLGILLAGHGLVHVLYLVPPPSAAAGRSGPRWPFDLGRSWLASRAGRGRTRRIARLLIGVVVAASVLAALATAGILVPAGWWAGLVVVAAGASLILLAVAFDPQLLLGIGIDVVLLWLVLVAGWSPVA